MFCRIGVPRGGAVHPPVAVHQTGIQSTLDHGARIAVERPWPWPDSRRRWAYTLAGRKRIEIADKHKVLAEERPNHVQDECNLGQRGGVVPAAGEVRGEG